MLATKHWNDNNYIRAAAYSIWWMNEFRMTEATFDDLLGLVPPHMQHSRVYCYGRRPYSKRYRLLLTMSFLAHVLIMWGFWLMYQQSSSTANPQKWHWSTQIFPRYTSIQQTLIWPSQQRTTFEVTDTVEPRQINLYITNPSVRQTNCVSLGAPSACCIEVYLYAYYTIILSHYYSMTRNICIVQEYQS